jgi:hypothetical protein
MSQSQSENTCSGCTYSCEKRIKEDPQSQSEQLAARYVDLRRRRDELDAELSEVKKEMVDLSEMIVESWIESGVSRITVNGMTVHLTSRFFCSKKGGIPTEAVVEALQRNGLGELVAPNYSPSRLTATIKELHDQDQVPKDLADLLRYDAVSVVQARAS